MLYGNHLDNRMWTRYQNIIRFRLETALFRNLCVNLHV